MNWKVNYWTILFAVVGIGWLVSSTIFGNKSQDIEQNTETTVEKDSTNPDRYKIPDTTATRRYDAFKKYAKLFNFSTSETAKPYDTLKHEIKSKHIINPNVRYFHLPLDGISEIAKIFNGLQDSTNSQTYALLCLKKNEKALAKDSQEIDLMFYIDGNSSDDNNGNFYDFTTPCPTFCEPPPPFE